MFVTSAVTSDPILSCPNGLALADDGNLYVANFGDSRVVRVSLEGDTSELVRLPGAQTLVISHSTKERSS